MTLNKFLFNIYCLSIFSIFIPITIYPLFFASFIIFNLVFFISNSKNYFSPKTIKLIFTSFIFIFISSISLICNIDTSELKQFFKIIINFLFLMNAIYFINTNFSIFLRRSKVIQYLLEAIISFTFVQVVFNVFSTNFWLMPFTGISDSAMAYTIVEPTIIFGVPEKNIWATKIAFIQIIYFSLMYFKYFSSGKLKFFLLSFFSLFNIIYTFSRTALLIFMLFILFFYLWKIFYVYKGKFLRLILVFLLLIISIPIILYIYQKLFHITLDSADGLASRFILWKLFFDKFEYFNLLYGNGILFAKHLVAKYSILNNDNFHNVFLNIFSDQGILGLLFYVYILRIIFFNYRLAKKLKRYISFVLFLPFFVCINSQYLGYDNDIIVFFTFIFILSKVLSKNNIQRQLLKENHKIIKHG